MSPNPSSVKQGTKPSHIPSPAEAGSPILQEAGPLPDTESVDKDGAHEEQQGHSSLSSEDEGLFEDGWDHKKGAQIRKMTDYSFSGPTSSEEAFKPSYQELRCDIEEHQDFDELYKRWKEMAQELSSLRAKHEPVNQLDAGDLVNSAKQLKFRITNLSRQWPDNGPLKSKPTGVQYQHHLQSITPENSGYRTLFNDSTRQPQIVKAFIWRVLTCEVFGWFHWAGEAAASSARRLGGFLASTNELDRTDIQMWTSKTTELLLKAHRARSHDEVQADLDHLERLKRGIIASILEALGPSLSSDQYVVKDLGGILDNALDLDKKFSQQVARWEWRWGHWPENSQRGVIAYNEESMESDEEEVHSSKRRWQRVVKLVISPALVKRGDSNGDNYDEETIAMRMGVSSKGFQR